MIHFIMCQIVAWILKYHDKKSDKYPPTDERYVYHVKMMGLYLEVMKNTIEASKMKLNRVESGINAIINKFQR